MEVEVTWCRRQGPASRTRPSTSGSVTWSAKESLRVANTSAKTSRKKASQRGAAVSSYDNLKVPELQRRAKKAGIKGRSTMNKKQLVKALRAS